MTHLQRCAEVPIYWVGICVCILKQPPHQPQMAFSRGNVPADRPKYTTLVHLQAAVVLSKPQLGPM